MGDANKSRDELRQSSELQQRIELICDLTRRLELLDALMATAREKRVDRERLSDQLRGSEVLAIS